MAERVVPFGPLGREQRLSFAVRALLAPIPRRRVAGVMPVHCAGMKAEPPAAFLEPPADIDVIAGGAIAWIEAADRGERGSPERHVASGDVLGLAIRDQH